MAEEAPISFLSADWHDIIMLSFEVDGSLLQPLVPPGLSLDLWHNKAFVTLVGLTFTTQKLMGLALPFLPQFPQVNLRFYVSRSPPDATGRGVVFIKEIVPRPMVAFVARMLFGQNYVVRPMKYSAQPAYEGHDEERLEYEWRHGTSWERMGIKARPAAWSLPAVGSREEFVVERYAGYARDGLETRMFRVAHPPWRIRPAQDAWLAADIGALVGREFTPYLQTPAFAFIAEGGRAELYGSSILKKQSVSRS